MFVVKWKMGKQAGLVWFDWWIWEEVTWKINRKMLLKDMQ